MAFEYKLIIFAIVKTKASGHPFKSNGLHGPVLCKITLHGATLNKISFGSLLMLHARRKSLIAPCGRDGLFPFPNLFNHLATLFWGFSPDYYMGLVHA